MKTAWFLMDVGESDAFSVFDVLPTGCILVDNGVIIAANQSFVEMIGVANKTALLNKALSTFFCKEMTESKLLTAATSKVQLHIELTTSTGKIPALAKVSRQQDSQKTKNGYLISLTEAHESPETSLVKAGLASYKEVLFDKINNITESYFVHYNAEGEILNFNESAEFFHKRNIDVDIKCGMHYDEMCSFDQKDTESKNYFQRAVELGEVERKCNFISNRNVKRYFDISYRRIDDYEGRPIGVLEYGIDVSKSVKLALDNHEAEVTIQGLVDNNEEMVVVYNMDLDLMFFNKTFEDCLEFHWGLTPRVGVNYIELFENMPQFQEKLEDHKRVLDDGISIDTSFSITTNDIKYYIKNRISSLTNREGKIIAIVSRTKDVTKEFNKTKEIEKSNSTLKAILESSLSGICALDQDYNVVAYNQTAYGEFLRYAGVDLSLPMGITDQLDKKEFERWDKDIFSRVMKGESFSTIIRREKDKRVHRNNYTPVINERNEIIAALEMSQDITDYVKSKMELQFRKDRMKTILDNTPAGLANVDLEGRIRFVSEKGAAFFSSSPKEMEGKLLKDVVSREHLAKYSESGRKLLNGDESVFLDLTFDDPKEEGKKIYTQGVVTLIRKDNGDPEEFFLSILDITDKVKNESLLVESQDTYQKLFSNMKEAVIVCDKSTGRVQVVNRAAEKLLGRSSEELQSIDLSTLVPHKSIFIPDEDIKEYFKNFQAKSLGEEEVEAIKVVFEQPDGSQRLVDARMLHLKEKTDVNYMILVDLTEGHIAQIEIKKKSSIFESLIHNSFDAIDVVKYNKDNPSEGGIYLNPQLLVRNEKMIEMVGGNLVYDTPEQFMKLAPKVQPDGSDSYELVKHAIEQTMKTGQYQTEFRLEHSGKTFDVVASQKILAIENDIFLIKNFRDISKEVEARNIIKAQILEGQERNQELEKYIESNLQLENFAYIASHDLKAPIRSVISFAQLLKNNVYKDLDSKNQRFLDIMISASTNMQVLIDDLLAYSRINTQAIEFEEIKVNELLNHLLIEINSSIEEKNGEVIIGEMPEVIVADVTRIRQVFQNLITNALKFHKEGETPKVEVSYKELPSKFEFSVRDYGIGVEEKYLSEIFLMFKKLHSENKFKGTGIGLSICKKITEQHGGSIKAESTIGEGTTIIFTISKNLKVNI